MLEPQYIEVVYGYVSDLHEWGFLVDPRREVYDVRVGINRVERETRSLDADLV